MVAKSYDIITVGGGIAGASLAKVMAEKGAKVLVLERDSVFRDRVRGEAIMPWGTAEAKELGLYETFIASGGRDLVWWDGYQGSERTSHRELTATTTPKEPVTAFHHPTAQSFLIRAAADAGAEIRLGVRVLGVKTGDLPQVLAEVDGEENEFRARLVVGADGRDAPFRGWAGFNVLRDPGHTLVAGLLLDEVPVDDDSSHAWLNSDLGLWVLIFPQGGGRVRGYVCYGEDAGFRLSGDGDISRFIEQSINAGMSEGIYASAKPAGPLATFDGAASWIDHPYRNGIALIGAAAGAPDPTWGQGLSLSLRDVRVLRDALIRDENWDLAGNSYADEHDRYFKVIHDIELWETEILMKTGEEADARRKKAFAAWREDRTRQLDVMLSGPIPFVDETTKRRFFGEE
ncbi:MAG: hypothetical protein BZY75_00155 [SAR202 cluster bacterium Io17-Chloro-G7]|nr:MAG: hypothetical protein BZY75_00155 [SAR202 cluster bacterium Io17-Chloro-G7]